MAGILDAFNDPSTQGLLSLSANFLRAGGPSETPSPNGAAFGNAFQGYQRDQQQQALINLEQQKGALTAAQVAQAQYGLAKQNWALGNFQGPAPQLPNINMPGMPQQAPQQPPQQPMGAPQQLSGPPGPQMSGAPGAPGGPMAGLPQYLQDAARYKMGGLPEMGAAVEKANEPIIGREGGLFQRGPNGLQLDPGWLAGEKQRLEQKQELENKNTVVDVPLANGQVQKMTKAQQLSMVGATNQVKAAVPGLSDVALSDIQRQMAADPDKPIDLNITLSGRQAKLTIPPLNGMPGATTGQSTEARSAQEASGTAAGGVQAEINKEADNALVSRRILGEMRVLSQDFTPSKIAPMQRTLGEYAQALNLPGDWSKEIKGAESQQALQKLTAQMATAAMKQFTNRGTQMEFKTFLQNNPNAELTPGGFQKVLEFMDQAAQHQLDKQQAYKEWRVSNPVEKSQDFLVDWNRKMNAEVGGESKQFPAPPQPAVNRLKMNPKERDQFDAIFGPGAAAKALGK